MGAVFMFLTEREKRGILKMRKIAEEEKHGKQIAL
jgi:hypothetical protein